MIHAHEIELTTVRMKIIEWFLCPWLISGQMEVGKLKDMSDVREDDFNLSKYI